MRTIVILLVLLGAVAPASADSFPVERGYYVESSASCQRASNATISLYDGVSFGQAYMECRKPQVRKLADGSYQFTERCRDMQGSGGPWQTFVSTYVAMSRTEFTVATQFGKFSYRYCKQSDLPDPWNKIDLSPYGVK